MYLRKSKKKNGRVYLTIAEAYRDERGKSMSRTVESLGYVDDLERSGIADPIGHFTEECARRNEARRAGTEPVIVKIGPLQRMIPSTHFSPIAQMNRHRSRQRIFTGSANGPSPFSAIRRPSSRAAGPSAGRTRP